MAHDSVVFMWACGVRWKETHTVSMRSVHHPLGTFFICSRGSLGWDFTYLWRHRIPVSKVLLCSFFHNRSRRFCQNHTDLTFFFMRSQKSNRTTVQIESNHLSSYIYSFISISNEDSETISILPDLCVVQGRSFTSFEWHQCIDRHRYALVGGRSRSTWIQNECRLRRCLILLWAASNDMRLSAERIVFCHEWRFYGWDGAYVLGTHTFPSNIIFKDAWFHKNEFWYILMFLLCRVWQVILLDTLSHYSRKCLGMLSTWEIMSFITTVQ